MQRLFDFPKASLVAALAVSTSLIAMPEPARADAGDFLGGVGVGVGGTLLYQHIRRNQQRRAAPRRYYKPRTRVQAPRYTIADVPTTRDQARDYQRRLNTLGFNAGTPDGIAGPRTRRAITAFQTNIGSAVTGRLSQNDISILVQRTSVAVVPQANSQVAGQYPVAPAPGYAPNGAQQPYPAGTQVNGAPAGQPGSTPAFPLANAAGQTGAGTAPAYNPQAAESFPLNQAAPQPNQQSAGTGFPALGNSDETVTASTGNSFPAVNAPAFAPETEQSFPQVTAGAAGGQGSEQFPALPQTEQQTAALQTTPATQNATAEPHSSGMAGVSQYKPAIFGITPGDEFASVSAKLVENGFTSCSDEQGTMVCDKDDGAIIDKVLISHKAGSGGSDSVYLAAREITFAKPVSRSFLLERMASAYPELLGAPDFTIAKASCQEHLNSKNEKPIPVHFTNAIESKDDMGTFLAACPSYYSIRFEEAGSPDMLKAATITFFDGTLIEDVPASTGVAAGTSQDQVESEVGEALKF